MERKLLSARLDHLGCPPPQFITLAADIPPEAAPLLGSDDILMVAVHPSQHRRKLAVRKLRAHCEAAGRGAPRLVAVTIPIAPLQAADMQDQGYEAILFKPYSLEALRAVLQGRHDPLDQRPSRHARKRAA